MQLTIRAPRVAHRAGCSLEIVGHVPHPQLGLAVVAERQITDRSAVHDASAALVGLLADLVDFGGTFMRALLAVRALAAAPGVLVRMLRQPKPVCHFPDLSEHVAELVRDGVVEGGRIAVHDDEAMPAALVAAVAGPGPRRSLQHDGDLALLVASR